MNKIWEFFENLDEIVYVSDMDNYELVYMNKKALEIYGFHTMEEIVGKKCYELIQHGFSPCSICNNHELVPGYFKEWEYYNHLLEKHFKLKDTMIEENGRRYRIEMAFDVSIQEKRRSMIHTYQNLEAMINEGLRIALQEKTPSQTLDVLLEYLGKALNGERTYIFEKNANGGDDNTYEWVAKGVIPQKDNLQNVAPKVCASWYQRFGESKHIIIENVEDIREKDPLQYEILKRQNIHSLVVVPLFDGGEAIGFFGVDNPPEQSLEYASDMFQITAHFIVSSLKRRNLIRELQERSYRDQLTEVGNRHAMNEYIEHMQCGQSVGVVYCDVTGLKRINDMEGHKAGDRLLLNACDSLKEVFGEQGLFRVGGDELLVICNSIEENGLWEKVKELKENLQAKAVEMAVGAAWDKDGSMGIDRLMGEAEKRMYKDKAEYYKTAGIDRRRQRS